MTCPSKSGSRERGSVLVEFTLLITLMLLFFFGIVDFSMAITKAMALNAAAQAGARYGAAEGQFYDTAGMTTAATTAAPSLSGLTVTSSTYCTCASGGVLVDCTTAVCNGYDLPMQYTQVKASASIPLFLPFPGLPTCIPMSATAVMRIR